MENKYPFSVREKDVIELLLKGKSNAQIAQLLGISISTVEFHLKNIYTKLGVNSRVEAVLKLSEYKLGESIGISSEKLKESVVDKMSKSTDNNGQPALKRMSMKKIRNIIGGLFITVIILLFLLSNLQSKNNTVIPTATSSATLSPATFITVSSTPQTENCLSMHEVTFCVKGIALAQDFTYVMLEIRTQPNIRHDGMGFIQSSLEGNIAPILKDDLGNEYNPIDDQSLMVFPGFDNQTYQQTMKFPHLNEESKYATLKFQSIVTSIHIQSSILLDLGETPQPGQVIPLDQTLNIQEQEIHLTKAELSGDGTNSLHIDIWSDPVKFKDNIAALMLNLGIPDGTGMGTGFGSKMILPDSSYHIFAELIRPGMQPVSGVITIPVDGVSIYYKGDFIIPFSIPASGVYSEITPTLDQSAQIAEIRRFANNPNLDVTFVTFENVNNTVRSALYFTKDGAKYWVETRTSGIVQFDNVKTTERLIAKSKNTDEIKNIAEQFAFTNSHNFQNFYNDLVLSEKLDGNLYIFRWEYVKTENSDFESPFIQVIVSCDGNVVGFTNTIEYFEK